MELNIETYCPVFSGFYGSVFEDIVDFDEYDVADNPDDFTEDEINKMIQEYHDNFNWKKYESDIAKNFVDEINNKLPFGKLEFEEIYSPKEYNFTNDSINVKWIVSESELRKFFDYLKNHKEEFSEWVNENFSSRSGFISFHSNNSYDWIREFNNKEYNCTKIGASLDFYFQNEKITEYEINMEILENCRPWKYVEITDSQEQEALK